MVSGFTVQFVSGKGPVLLVSLLFVTCTSSFSEREGRRRWERFLNPNQVPRKRFLRKSFAWALQW